MASYAEEVDGTYELQSPQDLPTSGFPCTMVFSACAVSIVIRSAQATMARRPSQLTVAISLFTLNDALRQVQIVMRVGLTEIKASGA